MGALVSLRLMQRITVITDETLEAAVIDEARRLGADSYICTWCSGKSLQDAFERSTGASKVRIEILAGRAAADAILEHLRGLQVGLAPVMAVMDTVEVAG